MSKSESKAASLLANHGTTFAAEAGIRLRDKPAPLFQLLYLALLLSARISSEKAVSAAAALKRAGLTTPRKMAEATWQDRVDVLTANGYKRYDESAARMLGSTAELVRDKYGGDLRKMRKEADGSTETLRELLQAFKGIGKVGADIFLREVQGIWGEVYPFADERAQRSAERHKLPKTAAGLSRLVRQRDFPRLVAALIRSGLR